MREEDSKQVKPILIFYISISGIRSEDIENFISKISKRIMPNMDAEAIIIPIDGQTRVECINPVYITNGDLIKTHERLLAELHEHINYQIDKLKNKTNE